MNKKITNKIAQKYRQWIIDAMIVLLKEYPYEDITIKQITLQADVSRQTFYRHFKSKEDIIRIYSDVICDEIAERLLGIEEKSVENLFRCYFLFWNEHKDILELVRVSNCEHLLIAHYNEVMMDTLDILKDFLTQYNDGEFALIKAFLIGGLYNMKMFWQNQGYQEKPEEVARLVSGLFES